MSNSIKPMQGYEEEDIWEIILHIYLLTGSISVWINPYKTKISYVLIPVVTHAKNIMETWKKSNFLN